MLTIALTERSVSLPNCQVLQVERTGVVFEEPEVGVAIYVLKSF